MYHYSGPQGDIFINFSEDHDFDVSTSAELDECEAAVKVLLKYPYKKDLSPDAEKSINLLIEKGACLHPEFFLTGEGLKMNRRIPERFVIGTSFGFSLFECLGQAGIYALINKRTGGYRDHLQAQIFRIMASITMMVIGADELDQLPAEVVADILTYFRTPDGLRWRTGLLASEEISVTCFREVARAFGKYFNNQSFLDKARQNRVTDGKSVTWRMIEANPTPLQGDLLTFYERFSEYDTGKPRHNRAMIMSLDQVISRLGFTNLRDALRAPLPKNALLTLYQERTTTLRAHTLNAIRQSKRFSDFVIMELSEEEPASVYFPIVSESDLANAVNLGSCPVAWCSSCSSTTYPGLAGGNFSVPLQAS